MKTAPSLRLNYTAWVQRCNAKAKCARFHCCWVRLHSVGGRLAWHLTVGVSGSEITSPLPPSASPSSLSLVHIWSCSRSIAPWSMATQNSLSLIYRIKVSIHKKIPLNQKALKATLFNFPLTYSFILMLPPVTSGVTEYVWVTCETVWTWLYLVTELILHRFPQINHCFYFFQNVLMSHHVSEVRRRWPLSRVALICIRYTYVCAWCAYIYIYFHLTWYNVALQPSELRQEVNVPFAEEVLWL